jgi:kynurenine formamidase
MKEAKHFIDLTHTLHPQIPTWNGSCGFCLETKLEYDQCTTDVKFKVQQMKLHAGLGTHIDAPSHCIPGGQSVEAISLETLVGEGIKIDISDKADATYSLTKEDVLAFEAAHGPIPSGAIVLIETGWGERYWDQPERYRNGLTFPSVSKEAILELLSRGIKGLGIDTLSPDRPNEGFPVHANLLGAGKWILENVANLKLLPPKGFHVAAYPIKAQGATEAPVRLVAWCNVLKMGTLKGS